MLLTLKVPHPYTRPSAVNAKDALSDATTCVHIVPSGTSLRSTSAGVDSCGLTAISSESESLSSASISFMPPSQVVSLPRADWSLMPHVKILLYFVSTTVCIPPTATWTTPIVSAGRRGFNRGLLTSRLPFALPRPSSPLEPSPKT